MALFEKKQTIDELQKRLADFDRESARLASELDKAQRRVSAILARDEDATKALQLATSLKIALDARPAAKAAIERELRRLQRAEQVGDLKKTATDARTWATGPMAKAGEQLISAIVNVAKALEAWDTAAAAAPLGAGPGGNLVAISAWGDLLRLSSLAGGLEALAHRKGAGPTETVVRSALAGLQQRAADALMVKINKLDREEAEDAEVGLDEPAAAAGGGSA